MSTPNVPELQTVIDTAEKTVVKVTGYFTAATNSNTVVVSANSLQWANTSRPCIISIKAVQYTIGFANGFCRLEWISGGAAANSDILALGGKTSSQMACYMPNPLVNDGNTANINGGLSGDIGMTVQGAEPLDSYSILITINKEGDAGGGYANVYAQYNDNDFGYPQQPI